MGMPLLGILKMASFGGLGVWWLIDIVRIGCAPCYAGQYRLAYDLPHWAFVMVSVTLFALLGYYLSGSYLMRRKTQRLKSKMLQAEEKAFHQTRTATVTLDPRDTAGMPYKSTMRTP